MATDKELSSFLESIERRAFKHAIYMVRNEESALDIIQDSMIKLSEKYGDKPVAELAPLFQRILQNTILDFFRREKVKNSHVSLFSSLSSNVGDDDDFDILEVLSFDEDNSTTESAENKLEREQVLNIIDDEIKKLPLRQREAFLMRYWEDMDVAETAIAMGCSQGSVKTHCSRATHALAASLKLKGIRL